QTADRYTDDEEVLESEEGFIETAATDDVVAPSWGDGQSGPSIDLTVHFAYDSAQLARDARSVLRELGEALQDPELRDKRFLIAGHTDAAGAEAYNLRLSFNRAEAVTAYLVQTHKIDPDRLEIAGYGEEQLKDWDRPESGVNRRVQIFNLGEATSE
ncbi:MAG: OmpA family protein, partial [Pseudomonadota bacterium]